MIYTHIYYKMITTIRLLNISAYPFGLNCSTNLMKHDDISMQVGRVSWLQRSKHQWTSNHSVTVQ